MINFGKDLLGTGGYDILATLPTGEQLHFDTRHENYGSDLYWTIHGDGLYVLDLQDTPNMSFSPVEKIGPTTLKEFKLELVKR